ncbi:MAG TPA: phospho-N-acetylmuramoyl-pentapeptide-transferase [Firmicutes bacterium]|nr:phospho-N-acetylmuramoyl-pentapeptide-transferase [Bacillota bacterium]
MALGSPLILRLKMLKFGQRVRADGPPEHLKKSGIPTMGGVIILAGLTLSLLVVARRDLDVLWALFVTLGFGLIGLADDFIMIILRRSLGLRARAKLAGQVLISLILAVYCLSRPDLGTAITLPFVGTKVDPGLLYIPFAVLVVVGSSNAVNLTDGLDGLAAGTSAIAATAYVVVCYAIGKDSLAVFPAAIAGACMGFMWFNAHPAQVFMGDTGSLALGGAFGALALLSKTELLLAIIGGVFVIEALSVMLQVIYFKWTGGRRILKMSPIHHHFELSGWLEPKVVVRFWIVGCIFAMLGIISVICSGR